MKKIIVLVMNIMMFSVMIFAQSPSVEWAENGISIRQGLNIEWTRSSVAMNDGVVIVWSDTQNGGRDLLAQKIDINGNNMWGETDLIIDNKANRQEDPVIIATTDNSVIIAWVDYSIDESGDIYAQKISSDGNLLWNTGGVVLCNAEGEQKSLNIVPDQNGGALVIWLDKRLGDQAHIFGQHLNSDGSLQWAENGILLTDDTGEQKSHTFWEDGQGGAILAYVNKVDDMNIFATRINGDGTMPWGNHIVITDAPLNQESPKITPDGTGSFIVTWRDLRNTNHGEIYAQKINLDGELAWSPQKIISSGDFDHKNPRLINSGDNSVIIVWEDGRNDPNYMDLFAQKISNSGELLWTDNGVIVSTEAFHQRNPRIISDNNGGAFIVWDDGRNNDHPNEDIYIQHLLSNGNPDFENNGRVVSNAIGEQYSALARQVDGNIFIIWGDKRSGSDAMYSQILNSEGNYVLTNNGKELKSGLSGDAENLISLKRNNKIYMIWVDSRRGSFGKQIFMQIIDGDGNKLLTENGIPIAENNGSDQEELSVCLGEEQGIVATWNQLENGYKQVYAQYVYDDGTRQWGDNGLKITTINNSSQSKSLVSNENGNYYIVFEDNRNMAIKDIFVQKIVNGTITWGDGKLVAENPDMSDYDLLSISDRYVIWSNPGNQHLMAKMFDENGYTAPGWSSSGLIFRDEYSVISSLKTIKHDNNVVISWASLNAEFQKDIYVQELNPEGQELFEHNGINIAGGYYDQFEGDLLLENQYYLVYSDFQNGNNSQIYANKFNLLFSPIWENPLQLGGQEVTQSNPTINRAGSNFLVVWENVTNITTDLSMQIFNPYGGIHGNAEGEVLCNKPFNQISAKIISFDDDSDIISWIDSRSSGKTEIKGIYAQKVSTTNGWTSNENDEVSPISNSLKQNYPNPFLLKKNSRNVTTIKFNLKYSQNVELTIFNIKGQKVKTLIKDKLDKGNRSISWDGKNNVGINVSSGVYFYSLKANGTTNYKKMLIVK
jgi:hypothetical protein